MKKALQVFIFILIILSGCRENNNLKSWNDTENKAKIIEYVRDVTCKKSKNFIPVEDRIAVFDNDGTLWNERPLPYFLFIKNKIMGGHYDLDTKAFKDIKAYFTANDGKVEFDEQFFKSKAFRDMMRVIPDIESNVSPEEYEVQVKDFFNGKTKNNYGITMDEIAYKPQVELIKYLQSNGFKVYIVSGGDTDFIRAISKDMYNIDRENVIGSSVKYSYDYDNNNLVRTNRIASFNNKKEKPENIARYIGKIPVIAVGNIGNAGDLDMLKYSQSSKYKNIQFLVNHDDAKREAEYYEKDNRSINEAKENCFNIISMKNDWKTIFNRKK